MYRQHSLTGKSSETLALQNKNKHKTLFNCFMTSHAFQKVTLQNADNSELNFLGWKKWRQQKPDHRCGFSGSTCKCHCHENARLQPPPAEPFVVPPGERWIPRHGLRLPPLAQLVRRWSAGFSGEPAPKPTNQPSSWKNGKGYAKVGHTTNFEVLRDCSLKTSSRIQKKWITTNLA